MAKCEQHKIENCKACQARETRERTQKEHEQNRGTNGHKKGKDPNVPYDKNGGKN